MNPQKYNYCPRCGTKTKKGNNNQQGNDYCPNCEEKIFRNSIPWAGIALFDESGKILMVKRGNRPAKGLWSVPAGFLDLGEHPREAAVRELYEETRLKIESKSVRIAECITNQHLNRTEAFGVIYAGLIEKAEGRITASDDAEKAKIDNPEKLSLDPVAQKMDFESYEKLVLEK